MRQDQPQRHALAAGFGLVAGLALALMDSRPGFDATGVSAGGLILAGAAAALIDGSGAFGRAFLIALLVGAPIVLIESQSFPAPTIALAFAGIGAFSITWARRLLRDAADA